MKTRVFEIFKQISAVPRGSQNMKPIADFCEEFALKNNLKYIRDNSDNIIIFKEGINGGENKAPLILQGHLDMVCQKAAESTHDFLNFGIKTIIDGDFIKADNTTLGADNGIALALIMAILESKNISHPPIEAVFTVDEEIGMLGAIALDTTPLTAKRMINLDSEEDDTVTVSCAGGSEFLLTLPISREHYNGKLLEIRLFGLKGGHSGVEIDKGRVNANALAGRILNHIKTDFRIMEINGGDKSNAITDECVIKLAAQDGLAEELSEYCLALNKEISAREPDFKFTVDKLGTGEYNAFSKALTEKLVFLLVTAPYGIVNMSAEIQGLVETSLNLGILKTDDADVNIDFSLRSNKVTALSFLEEKLSALAKAIGAKTATFGHYPPWEYKAENPLQETYCKCFKEIYGKEPKIAAIHAGLECGVFDSKIEGLRSIAVGPQMYDVHTVNERLSISSTEGFTELLIKVLGEL